MAKKMDQTGRTKLAEMAGAARLKGPVNVTSARGVTQTFASEQDAFEAWKDRIGNLTHRRGAFFEKAALPTSKPKDSEKPKSKPSEK